MIEIGDDSLHWQRSLKFLDIVGTYVEKASQDGLDFEARRRLGVEQVSAAWASDPPNTPVIIAGSTEFAQHDHAHVDSAQWRDSRKERLCFQDSTSIFPRRSGSRLVPAAIARTILQYRFAALFSALDMTRDQVATWGEPPDKARNELVSLFPAPGPGH